MTFNATGLTVGEVYFIVLFDDADLRIPIVQTLIYCGEKARGNGTKYFSFRELHRDGAETQFGVDPGDASHLLLDRSGLLDKLNRCFNGELAKPPRR